MSSLALLVLSLFSQMTAEGFLQTLCDTASTDGGAAYWMSSAAGDADGRLADPDTLEVLLPTLRYLSVLPGAPSLLEADNSTMSYRVSFPEAEWNWTDRDGRVRRARGETVVEQREGRFYWVSLPLYREGASAGPMEKLVMALTLTGIVLLFGVIVLWWVRRRYRES